MKHAHSLIPQLAIGLLLLLLPIPMVKAQKASDSLTTKHFNALDYSMQKRYKQPDDTFVARRFTDNMYIIFQAGLEYLAQRGNTGFGNGPRFGFTAGKLLDTKNALQLTLHGGWYTRQAKDHDLNHFGMEVSHLFNISAYINGYNPRRVFELSTMEGIGYSLATFNKATNHVGNLHLGLQLKIHPSSRMDLLLQPRVSFYTDNIDHSEQRNWHRYDFGYGGNIGLSYRFTASTGGLQSHYLFKENSLLDNTYLSFAAGAQLPMSADILQDIGIAATGQHFALTVGKWIIPLLGFQASAFASTNKWGSTQAGAHYLSTYTGGRIEAAVNLLSFVHNEANSDSPFMLTVLAGIERGRIRKETEKEVENINEQYTGFTAAFQAKYYWNKHIGIFVEPRLSLVPYPMYYYREGIQTPEQHNYQDNLFALSFGLELRRADNSSRKQGQTLAREHFRRRFSLGLGGGINLLLTPEQYHRNLGYQADIHVGYTLSPLSAFRLGADYAWVNDKALKREYKVITPFVNYRFCLTNFLAGYSNDRRLNVDFLAGAIVGIMENSKDGGSADTTTAWGGETGLGISYRLNRLLSIELEPKVRIYPGGFMEKGKVTPTLRAGVTMGW